MFKRVLLLITLTFALGQAQAIPLTVNFKNLADGNTATSDGTGSTGEAGYQPYIFDFITTLELTVRGFETNGTSPDTESYAYMDKGNAGMGVCTVITSTDQCSPSSDDNVSAGEYLRLSFNENVLIESLTLNNNHDGGFDNSSVNIDGVIKSGLSGGAKTFTDSWFLAAGDFLDLAYVDGVSRDNHFYLETLVVSQVPEPSVLLLIGSGLLGFGLVRIKRTS